MNLLITSLLFDMFSPLSCQGFRVLIMRSAQDSTCRDLQKPLSVLKCRTAFHRSGETQIITRWRGCQHLFQVVSIVRAGPTELDRAISGRAAPFDDDFDRSRRDKTTQKEPHRGVQGQRGVRGELFAQFHFRRTCVTGRVGHDEDGAADVAALSQEFARNWSAAAPQAHFRGFVRGVFFDRCYPTHSCFPELDGGTYDGIERTARLRFHYDMRGYLAPSFPRSAVAKLILRRILTLGSRSSPC